MDKETGKAIRAIELEVNTLSTTIELGFENMGKRLAEYVTAQRDTDTTQFAEIGKNRVAIAEVGKEVEIITSRMKNGGIPAYIKLPWRKIVLGLGLVSSTGYAVLTWASDAILYVRDNALDIFLK